MSESRSPLFEAFAKEGIVRRDVLLETLKERGIQDDDPRLKQFFKSLNGSTQDISESQFQILADQNPALLKQISEDDLIVPDFKSFIQEISLIFDDVNQIRLGKLATYIPQLERVDPDKFAVAVCTIDGQRFSLGDAQDYFCVQSCSKPITYCLALEEQGEEIVHSYVGREPSGKTFNELTLNAKGLPHNPMINAGAIMCGALIKKGGAASDRFDYVMEKWKEAAGGQKIGFNNAVYLSERQTADRNFALGYFMREKKAFPPESELLDVLEFYFQCCSIETTARSMAIVAATLANSGICPLTGKQIFRPDHVKNCLSLMLSCGMYDFSGEFAFSVGIPAKSGVSGAIILAIPGVGGITVWSPLLDELGNSVRGVEFCKRLVSRFRFHTFDNLIGKDDNRIDPRRYKK